MTEQSGEYVPVPKSVLRKLTLPCTNPSGRFGEDRCDRCPNCKFRASIRLAAESGDSVGACGEQGCEEQRPHAHSLEAAQSGSSEAQS